MLCNEENEEHFTYPFEGSIWVMVKAVLGTEMFQ